MKRLLVGLALLAAACSGQSPTAPSGTSASGAVTQAPATPVSGTGSVPTVDPTPGGPNNTATVPQFTFTGPRSLQNCFTAGTDPMQWVLNVTDAGPRALHLVALAHQDDTPGCEATAKNPRARVAMSGVTDYTAHSVGQTTFTFDPKMYNCGRVQVDVSIFDAAGNEILILGTVINYGSQCTPPSGALVCAPPSQTGLINQTFNFTATGGNGTYSWSSPSGSTLTGSGASYATSYANTGAYVITVTSGGQTATCQATVQSNVTVAPFCTPSTQNVGLNLPATITAGGGNGIYSWSAPGGSVTTGTGSSFTTTYATVGTHVVTLTSSGQTTQCTVITPPTPPLVCNPQITQVTQIGQLVNFTATGGDGNYTWSSPGGTPAGAAEPANAPANYSTTYSAAGSYTVTVTSAGQTSTCPVSVQTTPPPPTLVCTPPTQTVAINTPAPMSVGGSATGPFTWTATGATTPTGTGTNFSPSYATAGTYSVTVTNGTLTGTCQVVVPPTPPPPTLACTPPAQNGTIGSPVNFGITGTATGPYTWTAVGATTPTGTGATFSATYTTAGSYSVTVTNGTITSAACTVTIPPPPPPPLVCTPPTQTAQIGQTVPFAATGGTGTYSWAAPGGTTTTGTGANFTTSYGAAGTYTATVTSGAQTQSCVVNVPPPQPSCVGVTASILDMLPPTVDVQVNVPAGQTANMIVQVNERPQDIWFTYTQLVTQTGQIHVPGGCFVKVRVFCGAPTLENELDAQNGPNTCAP